MTQQENMLSAPYICCPAGVPTAGCRALPTGPAEASTHTYVSFVYSNQYYSFLSLGSCQKASVFRISFINLQL